VNSCALDNNWVLTWQIKLHEWAFADRQRVFHDVYNLVYDPRSLRAAWRVNSAKKLTEDLMAHSAKKLTQCLVSSRFIDKYGRPDQQ